MRAFRHLFLDIDRQLEDAARAKHQLDAERWRDECRPRAMRLFASQAKSAHVPTLQKQCGRITRCIAASTRRFAA